MAEKTIRNWHLGLALSKQELAAELGVSARTVERLRAAGQLPPCIPGIRRPRWYREAIVRWLEAGELTSKGKCVASDR